MANVALPVDYAPRLLSGAWREVHGTAEGAHLTSELKREVCAAHVLKGLDVTAVAVRGFTADPGLGLSAEVSKAASAYTARKPKQVIYWVSSLNCWAVVHLTWATETETDPLTPSTVLAHEWAAVIEELVDRDRP